MSESTSEARVAVVVPCYNDGATVGETVESILAQEPTELVVVDDGSSDPETSRVMDRLRLDGIRVLRQENRGLPEARMAGVRATSARYLFPLDADDVLLPGALGELADALDAHADAVAAWGDTEFFGDANVVVRSAPRIDPWRLTFVNELPAMSLFRRKALVDAGGWTLKGGYEDWELWMALAERGWDGVHIRRPVARYRVHGTRMWRDSAQRHDEIVAELRHRHPDLFAQREQNRLSSSSTAVVKMTLPLLERSPLSPRTRLALASALTRPGPILRLAAGLRLNRMRRRLGGAAGALGSGPERIKAG